MLIVNTDLMLAIAWVTKIFVHYKPIYQCLEFAMLHISPNAGLRGECLLREMQREVQESFVHE